MSTPIKCPSCGYWNDPSVSECTNCNFPLHGDTALARQKSEPPRPAPITAPPATDAASGDAAPDDAHEPATPAIDIRRVRPIRTRPPRAPMDGTSQQLWLVVGGIAIALLVWQAFTGFHQSNSKPVAGAKPEQQKVIDQAREAIAADSTNLQARIALADMLYDTANWSEAIVHYRTANRIDPTRVTTVVDLGVCYYNLGDASTAKTLFTKALEMDPKQPVALFNLGVVAEFEKDEQKALEYYRLAQGANPPPGMVQPLEERIQGATAKLKGPQPTTP